MISFCSGEFTAVKIGDKWGLLQWSFAGNTPTLCASLGEVFEVVGAAKGLSDD